MAMSCILCSTEHSDPNLSLAGIKLQLGLAFATLHLVLFPVALDCQYVSKVCGVEVTTVGTAPLHKYIQHAPLQHTSNTALFLEMHMC